MNFKHGKAGTKEYIIWSSMKARCYNSNTESYKRYGGRGITVCREWINSFTSFYTDMGRCPSGLTLERKDNFGNYTPDNCEWVSKRDQANNRRTNSVLSVEGKRVTLAQADRLLKSKGRVVSQRVNKLGWSVDRAINTPVKEKAKYKSEVRGVTWQRSTGRWIARGVYGKVGYFLGGFRTEKEAVKARTNWEKEVIDIS